MLKRWKALPRDIRWLVVGIAAVMLALAVVWVLFVPVADWLAHHDVGPVTGSLRETAVDNARGRLLTLGAGLFAAGALIFTALNVVLSRRTVELSQRTFAQAERAQVTDRYTKAIEQLGSDKLDVRIGAIYSLERVASDSDEYHQTVMQVLTAFIRVNSEREWPENAKYEERSTRPDIQAAVTVVVHRDVERDKEPIDLFGAKLFKANLNDAKLGGATLCWADLTDAYLLRADLAKADLRKATIKTNVKRWDSMTNLDGARWSREDDPPKGWKAVNPEDPGVAADIRLLKRDDAGSDERDAIGPSA